MQTSSQSKGELLTFLLNLWTLAEKVQEIKTRYEAMKPFLTDERLRRTWAATEAAILGHGGLKVLSEITGLTDATISKGMKEIRNPSEVDITRIRISGGGRKTYRRDIPRSNRGVKANT